MDQQTPLLELKGITFSYPDSSRKLFVGVDFVLQEYEGVGLIGANGSGKTTLFCIIMGLIKPDIGWVLFRGEPMRTAIDFKKLRREVGFLFQDADDQLFLPTVLEDVTFGPLNLGKSQEEARDIALQTLASLGLEEFREKITHHLSGGEKKLVSLATILAMKPKALLLDEPTTNLDPYTRERLLDILSSRNEACVIISHDWDFLTRTTKRVCVLENGKLTSSENSRIHYHPHIHSHGDKPHHHES
ncbi:MAG: energy-coupling factor ABC transporter ATP-binding protein [Thermodesulfobacteriota bacterium]